MYRLIRTRREHWRYRGLYFYNNRWHHRWWSESGTYLWDREHYRMVTTR